jgi:hypothetical protein
MRPLTLLAAATVLVALLAGCSSKPEAPDASLPTPSGGGPGDGSAPAGNATRAQMEFRGGFQETEVAVSESFAPTEACTLSECPRRSVDLTPLVPPDVPVELSVSLSVDGDLFAFLETSEDVSIVQSSSESSGEEISLDALLVRSPSGTVTLVLMAEFFAFESLPEGASATGTAHTVVRSSVVPAYVPVSVQLGPGETVNATGDGLEQFVAFAPDGVIVRDVTEPFGVTLPATAAAGSYTLFAVADEAVRLFGPPGRPLAAQRLLHMQTDAVPLQSGAPATWEAAVPGLPVWIGVVLESSEVVPGCCSAGSYTGPHEVRLVGPGNVDVILEQNDCLLPALECPMALVFSYYAYWYGSGFLSEQLVPGAYTATVTADQAVHAQAYTTAVYIA